MSNGRDGGIWALAGYLYQIVGMLGMTAHVSSLPHGSNAADDVLVNLSDVSGSFKQAQHEAAGQDLLFRFHSLELEENDDCVLIQFKCSMTERPIGGPELKEIIKKLDKAAKEVSRNGQNVTACVLVTNRGFTSGCSDRAQEIWETEIRKTRSYELRRLSEYRMENFISELKRFGQVYGTFEEEIERGIRKLIGGVVLDTGRWPHDASIDKEDLIEAFTDCRWARPITIASVAEVSHEELSQFGERIGVDQWDSDLVEREIFQDVVEAISQRALVGLYGDGGCGKSILFWQLLNELQAQGCCTLKLASDLQRSWITDAIQKWRNLPMRSGDTEEDAIRRLKIANPDSSRPIMLLALDGLDAELPPDRESDIRVVLKWFWDKDCNRASKLPTATLVVSCRDENDLRDKWLELPPFYSGELPLTISIGEFSIPEMKDAARKKLPELYQAIRPRSRIQSTVFGYDYDTETFESFPPAAELDSVDEDVWESLKHPAMWYALLSLDKQAQMQAIRGNTKSVHKLAHQFILWFHWKLKLRQKRQFGKLTDNVLIEILRTIRLSSGKTSANSRDENWVKPACQAHQHQINRGQATDLYDEAVSAGLIMLEARHSWRWRHLIVCDYLANNSQAG